MRTSLGALAMSMATHIVGVEDQLLMARRISFRMRGGKPILRKPLSSRDRGSGH